MLYTNLASKARFSKKKETVLQAFCVGFPIVLVIFGYSLDTDDPDVANAVLNVARHGFKCSMRFASMPLEWIGIWARTWQAFLPSDMYILYSRILRHLSLFFELAFFCLDFLWSGALIFVFSFGSWWNIRSMQKLTTSNTGSNTKTTDPLERSKRRLMGIAMQTSACLLLNMVLHYACLFLEFWCGVCGLSVQNFLFKTRLPCHDYFQGWWHIVHCCYCRLLQL